VLRDVHSLGEVLGAAKLNPTGSAGVVPLFNPIAFAQVAHMEAVIFMGVQGAGKSSYFRERFFGTHVRISMDLMKTRHREGRFLELCLETGQRFVVDNTNPTREERSRYILPAKAARFSVVGYYFRSSVEECLRRNAERQESERVPEVAIRSAASRLEQPTLAEGFDRLWYVRIENGRFVTEEWDDAVR
jgi:predicted kinase